MFDTRETPQSRAQSSHRPHMNHINIGKHRTFAAGEHCDSIIRQRRGGKERSSHAESSSGPNPAPYIENVNNIGMAATTCVTRDTSEQAQCTLPTTVTPLHQRAPSLTLTYQNHLQHHAVDRQKTHLIRRQTSQVHHSAVTSRQDCSDWR